MLCLFTYIYHTNKPNVGINIPYMDDTGNMWTGYRERRIRRIFDILVDGGDGIFIVFQEF